MILATEAHNSTKSTSVVSEPYRSQGQGSGRASIYLSHTSTTTKPSEARVKLFHVQHFSAFLLSFTTLYHTIIIKPASHHITPGGCKYPPQQKPALYQKFSSSFEEEIKFGIGIGIWDSMHF
jgi:hypothetical protein